jgi:hypothetical protein
MAQRIKRRTCKHCGMVFLRDPRNATRQRYCSNYECRKASKASSQKRWLQKPENQGYFRGPDNAEHVQRWRKDHPGYWRRKPKNKPTALQDPLNQQLTENTDKGDDFRTHALQEDIAMVARRMQQLGNDILNSSLTVKKLNFC